MLIASELGNDQDYNGKLEIFSNYSFKDLSISCRMDGKKRDECIIKLHIIMFDA